MLERLPGWMWPRRFVPLYFRLTRGMTLGVRAAVLNAAGEVLLVRHVYTPGWHLPGGGVEVGETLLDTLAKELREEVMISLTGAPVMHGMFFNRAMAQRDHIAVFIVRDFAVDGVKLPDYEIAEARFFPLGGLPPEITAGTQRRLDEILKGQEQSSDW